ncbi:MAG: chemotaxis protein CheX [Spirochaetota bacterium]|nr:chemotaxis protein CheX [Spirochaetota bacterium]
MERHYIDPFITSAVKIIRKTTGLTAFKKNIYVRKGKLSLGGVGIILGIGGDIVGRVAYEFSRSVTIQLASKMISRSSVTLDDKDNFIKLLKSTISELGNLISGHAITHLLQMGYNCKITPPKTYIGQGVTLVPDRFVTFVIELQTECGDFVINLALEMNN